MNKRRVNASGDLSPHQKRKRWKSPHQAKTEENSDRARDTALFTADIDKFESELNAEKANVPKIIRTVANEITSPEFLNTIKRSRFLKEHISSYYKEIRYAEGNSPFEEFEEINEKIIDLFRTLLSTLPSSCDDILQVLGFMQMTNAALLRQKRVSDGRFEAIQELSEHCDAIVESRRKKKITVEDMKSPPDDFRKISVYPRASDIRRRQRAFIRKNKIVGAYANLDHYLDVHFRLLREDFIRTLIGGIKTYKKSLKSENREKNTDIRIYQTVQIIDRVCSNNGLCYRIQFQTKRPRKIQWKYSKRLIFGTLVCLSNDNFEDDFIFATVQNRDLNLLEQNCLEIRIEDAPDQQRKLNSKDVFVMAESTAYFEPYRHVLEGLQCIRQLPFERYILYCEKDIQCPKYREAIALENGEIGQDDNRDIAGQEVNAFSPTHNGDEYSDISSEEGQDHETKMDGQEEQEANTSSPTYHNALEPFLMEDGEIGSDNDAMSISTNIDSPTCDEPQSSTSQSVWDETAYRVPSRSEVDLDDTQYTAYKAALEKEFVLIQGPPGTGKTYVGLQIVKTLLQWHFPRYNPFLYRCKAKPPILVVCFTNHALDQFLEGILSLTPKVVRIGGRSKNKALDEKNIRNLRFHNRSDYEQKHAKARVNNLRSKLENIKSRLRYCNQGVLSLDEFINDIPINHRNVLKEASDPEILYWLGLTSLMEYNNSTQIPTCKSEEHKSTEQSYGYDHFAVQRSEHILDLENPNNTNESNSATELHATDVGLSLFIGEQFYNTSQDLDMRQKAGQDPEQLRQDHDVFLYAKRQLTQVHQINGYHDRIGNMNVWTLETDERWMLYRYWRDQYIQRLHRKKYHIETDYEDALRRQEDVQLREDLDILQTKEVLGMTTTGAAKLRKLLQNLRPKIILVEEAAEVLEAHIITTLSTSCEHLILIGDHKQLRPKPNVYDLAKNYNLEISLFERLIKNDLPYQTLLYQRRMRPEISKLLRKIYPELKDHNVVETYAQIRGVKSNYFFLNHNERETEDMDMELNSPSNVHEASFIHAFCDYLLKQGYGADQITILTPYAGQVKLLQSYHKEPRFADLKIAAIDNYQGEENDLVLLSLVRNNPDEKIGFLKDENRLCVSVSRARLGLYVIGNFDKLGAQSQLWSVMVETAKEDGCYGTFLPLRCQNHLEDEGIKAKEATDFKNAPEGGCMRKCEEILQCGHACESICHAYDREHKASKCKVRCNKVVCKEHDMKCTKECWNPKCSLCTKPVEKVRPDCGHTQQMKCGESVDKVQCKRHCEIMLKCGHRCPNKCHIYDDPDHTKTKCKKACEKIVCETHGTKCTNKCFKDCSQCEVIVEKKLAGCNHIQKVPCAEPLGDVQCEKNCNYRLDCGHVCMKQCHPNEDPEHEYIRCTKPCNEIVCKKHKTVCTRRCCDVCSKCTKMVTRKLPNCNHLQRAECSKPLAEILCRNPCGKPLPCGHKCPKFCHEPCVEPSKCSQPKTERLPCGHQGTMRCKDNPYFVECTEPCRETLTCLHVCQGTCGKCFSGRLHRSCKWKCTRTLICDHICSSFCTHSCSSCEKRCDNRCSHSRCPKRCGEPCPPCQEQCGWRCEHKRCTRKCYEECDREKCDEPCKEVLKCGHECIGLCGEPCPDKCLICDKDEVTEIFFGMEDEPGARFIQLSDCKHIFEVGGLDSWMEQKPDDEQNIQIKMKKCPKCSTIIRCSFRYGDIIKKALADIEQVKSKLNGLSAEERKTRREQLIPQTTDKHFIALLQKNISSEQLYCLELVVPLTNRISRILEETNIKRIQPETKPFIDYLRFQYKQLDNWAKRGRNRLSEQERSEAQTEFNRLDSYLQVTRWLCQMSRSFMTLSEEAMGKLELISAELFANKRLGAQNDSVIKLKTIIDGQLGGILNISREEQLQILKWGQENGIRKGAWYKCPNGHIYTIGECGGAMQSSKCPECKADIGGTQHRLTTGNTVASIMDGANHAAWSDQANMDNYDLDNLL